MYNNTDPWVDLTPTMMLDPLPDDLQAINQSISEYLAVEAPKLIDTASDAVFDAKIQALYNHILGIGYQQVADWYIQNWNNVVAKMG